LEDALKFAKREEKRGNKYSGIILDPPTYGRGPDGEKWILHDNINELISVCSKIIEPAESFLILNMYSIGFSALVSENLVKSYFNDSYKIESGELFVADKYKKKLPLGTYLRMNNF
jgi:23S rRNA (cytosine1962-C5)-methyltransferase